MIFNFQLHRQFPIFFNDHFTFRKYLHLSRYEVNMYFCSIFYEDFKNQHYVDQKSTLVDLICSESFKRIFEDWCTTLQFELKETWSVLFMNFWCNVSKNAPWCFDIEFGQQLLTIGQQVVEKQNLHKKLI